jgi:16S rRNA (guanine527-N7)-methyltransferase
MEIEKGPPGDPLTGDPRVKEYFGERFEAVAAFAALLKGWGIERGLIGPRETGRLWERHLLNSAAIVPFLPDGPMADVGSGAGLPGLVIAAMEPERDISLIEPMKRRAAWLEEAVLVLGLQRVKVIRARAEEAWDRVEVNSVVARAVAPVARLAPWCEPMISAHGEILLLKGRSAVEEVVQAREVLTRMHLSAEVLEAPTIQGVESTRVVRLRRDAEVGRDGR